MNGELHLAYYLSRLVGVTVLEVILIVLVLSVDTLCCVTVLILFVDTFAVWQSNWIYYGCFLFKPGISSGRAISKFWVWTPWGSFVASARASGYNCSCASMMSSVVLTQKKKNMIYMFFIWNYWCRSKTGELIFKMEVDQLYINNVISILTLYCQYYHHHHHHKYMKTFIHDEWCQVIFRKIIFHE